MAAGKGERMKSETPKVLHSVCGRPMLNYSLDLVKQLKLKKAIAVLGYKYNDVKKCVGPGIEIVIQKQQKGTADAVKQTLPLLKDFKGTVLVLYGDTPLLTKETVATLLRRHRENNSAATLLTATINKPFGYGRILRDNYSSIYGIIEEKDADEFQKDIKEINTGIACFDKDKLFDALKYVKPDNLKKEYYLTDIISIFYKNDCMIENINLEDFDEALGINSRVELAKANAIMQQRINKEFMDKGVTLINPESILISYGTKIGTDTIIYPFTVIERDVKIGSRCVIGPFAHLREGTRLDDGVLVGNFLEIVRSRLGSKTLMKHFSYIGDSIIGRGVNVGAGTVTANFDGNAKNTTVIKDAAFIGSHTVLVAPVKVGKGAKTGAGAVLLRNKNVPDGATVVGVPAREINNG